MSRSRSRANHHLLPARSDLRWNARQATRRRSALSLVVGLGLARSASAQAADSPLVEGARARVAAPALGPSPRIVLVVATRGDTLVVRPDEGTGFEVSVPLPSISGVEVRADALERRTLREWG